MFKMLLIYDFLRFFTNILTFFFILFVLSILRPKFMTKNKIYKLFMTKKGSNLFLEV